MSVLSKDKTPSAGDIVKIPRRLDIPDSD